MPRFFFTPCWSCCKVEWRKSNFSFQRVCKFSKAAWLNFRDFFVFLTALLPATTEQNQTKPDSEIRKRQFHDCTGVKHTASFRGDHGAQISGVPTRPRQACVSNTTYSTKASQLLPSRSHHSGPSVPWAWMDPDSISKGLWLINLKHRYLLFIGNTKITHYFWKRLKYSLGRWCKNVKANKGLGVSFNKKCSVLSV